jgi:pimeloyl-ACP methyl ester carboxylesterase
VAADEAFEDFFYQSADGLRLHAQIYGADLSSHLPVVCLPGLTRNARDFHELALHLSRAAKTPRKVVALDYRGRGQSAYDPDWKKYDIGIEASDVLTGLEQLGIARAAFVGTSRGGLIVHVLAVLRPDMLAAVVLNDIGPVLEAAGLQHLKTYLGKAPRPETFAEAAAAQKLAHGPAFPSLTDADWDRMARAIFREDGGVLMPDFDPALLNGLMATDLSQPLPDLWPHFGALSAIPLLAIRGENSLLLSAQTLAEMANRHPNFESITVAGQGHAPFLETGSLPARIADFIDRAELGTRRYE